MTGALGLVGFLHVEGLALQARQVERLVAGGFQLAADERPGPAGLGLSRVKAACVAVTRVGALPNAVQATKG